MKDQAILLTFDTNEWHISRIVDGEVQCQTIPVANADSDESIEAVATALDEWDYHGEGVCLGLPASWVLSARIDCDGLPRSERRTAMIYRLEEQLPLEAETLTVDFLPTVGGRAMGVAVQTDHVQQLLNALEGVGIEVAAICPTALLAARSASDEANTDYVVVGSTESADILRVADGVPVAWYAASGNDIADRIEADILANPASNDPATVLLVAEDSNALAETIRRTDAVAITSTCDRDPLSVATHAAEDVLAGTDAGWVDFRRDSLATANPWAALAGPIRSAGILAGLLLAILIGGFFYRGMQYSRLADQATDEQAAIYHDLFPNRPAPVGVKWRLESELKRTGATVDTALPPQPCALDTLNAVMTALPVGEVGSQDKTKPRVRLLEVRLDPTTIVLEGQTRDHSAAERVKRSLAEAGLSADRLSTRRLAERGVSFTLTGSPAKETSR